MSLIKKVGVANTIAKPFDLETLTEKVNGLLHKQAAEPFKNRLSPNFTYAVLWGGLVVPEGTN